MFVENTRYDAVDLSPLGTYKKMFRTLPDSDVTLGSALLEMGYGDIDYATRCAQENANAAKEYPSVKGLDLTEEEAGAIACFALPGYQGLANLRDVVNAGLAGFKSRINLFYARKFVYLLMSGLRKFRRTSFQPSQPVYSVLTSRVPLNAGEASLVQQQQYYEVGRTVTWWNIATVTTNYDAACRAATQYPEATIFSLYGEQMWGYNIAPFVGSVTATNEPIIVLEPELEFTVESIEQTGPTLVVSAKCRPRENLPLQDIIKVGFRAHYAGEKIINPITCNPESTATQFIEGHACGAINEDDDSDDNIEDQEENCGCDGAEVDDIAELAKMGGSIVSGSLPWGWKWRKYPKDGSPYGRFVLDKGDPSIATFTGGFLRSSSAMVLGENIINPGSVVSWSIKLIKLNGCFPEIGIVPACSDYKVTGYKASPGWYFNSYSSAIFKRKDYIFRPYYESYGLQKTYGEVVKEGDTVGIILDTKKGTLSFVLDRVNQGIAYKNIPLDTPLIPCVILFRTGDTIQIKPGVKTKEVSCKAKVPQNIYAKASSCNIADVNWDSVSDAEYYQIKAKGRTRIAATKKHKHALDMLLPGTETKICVRAVFKDSVSEWSAPVLLKMPSWRCDWGPSQAMLLADNYEVSKENHRIATKTYEGIGTAVIRGTTILPADSETSWGVKVLRSKDNNGMGIHIGISPYDEGPNKDAVWCIDCNSPNVLKGKTSLSTKKFGEYVHEGDTVGVIMNMVKGELSFVLCGEKVVAPFDNIRLDKPIVPCVLLKNEGDSVELVV